MNREPFDWMNDVSRQFLARDYLPAGQSGEARVAAIADVFAGHAGREVADRFHEYMSRGWYSLSSPVWSNYGLDRGFPISCFGTYVEDDTRSILRAHTEVGMMSKRGGGTSLYLSPLRPRGSEIRDNGHSAGSVNFALMFDTEIRVVSQGSSRRGECAVYWDIDHPDVPEALTIRHEGSEIHKLSYGLCVPSPWMLDLVAGDRRKRELWARVVAARAKTGYPYLFFVDNANEQAPDVYKNLGMRINHSNLCVAGDQRVVSDRGLKTAKELWEEGGELVLFDNGSMVPATPMQRVERDVDVYRISLANGMSHTVTGYHKVLVRVSGSGEPVRMENRACSDLGPGDMVAVQTRKGLFGEAHMPQEAFLLGLYQGDGTQTEKAVAIDLWENDFDLVEEVQEAFDYICDRYDLNIGTNGHSYPVPRFHDCVVAVSKVRKKRLIGYALKKFGFRKGTVPGWVWTGDEETQWQYVRGLLYTDGTAYIGRGLGNPLHISLASTDRRWLSDVQLLFVNLGLQSSVRLMRGPGKQMMPNGRGGLQETCTQACWRLIVSNKSDALRIDRHTGFLRRKGIAVEDREYRDNTKKFFAVTSVEHAGREDVYCCKVASEAHHFVCNGVVTHNCSEIMLPNSPEESFVCCLSSMHMLRYDEWVDTDAVEVMVRFLDSVMSEFIARARDELGFDRAVRFAERHRALGLGQIGWHHYLQNRGIPFASMEANALAAQTSMRIRDQAFAASARMASELGEPMYLEGRGRRHATLTAIAPTQSSSAILGQTSEGIEAVAANVAIKDKQKVKYTYRNPILMQLLADRGQDSAGVLDSIVAGKGSVQHLDFLSQRERDTFRTLREVSPMALVQQAAARQPYVCQGQSLNLLVDPGADPREVNRVYVAAWELGLKSLYYQKNVSAAGEFAHSLTQCSSCEG